MSNAYSLPDFAVSTGSFDANAVTWRRRNISNGSSYKLGGDHSLGRPIIAGKKRSSGKADTSGGYVLFCLLNLKVHF